MCLGDFSGHVGRHIDSSWMVWHRAEEFGRKNVIRVLSGEGIVCVKYML